MAPFQLICACSPSFILSQELIMRNLLVLVTGMSCHFFKKNQAIKHYQTGGK